jgi:hypothetical protein
MQVLDDGSEHQHRFSLTAELSIVGEVSRLHVRVAYLLL